MSHCLQTRILAKQVAKELKAQAEMTGTMTLAGAMGSQLAAVGSVAIPQVRSEAEKQNLAAAKKEAINNIDVDVCVKQD